MANEQITILQSEQNQTEVLIAEDSMVVYVSEVLGVGSSAGLPQGGSDGQSLIKVGSTNYQATWRNLVASDITDFSEAVDDQVSALIQDGTGISWSYDDVNGTLTPTVTIAPFTTSDLAEGSNLYFTDGRADTRIAAAVGVTVQAYSPDLDSLASLSGSGLMVRTGSATYTNRSVQGTSGQITVSNGSGLSGDPTVGLANAGTAGTYGSSTQIPVFTTDAQGRVISVTNTTVSVGTVSLFTVAGSTGTPQLVSGGETMTIAAGSNMTSVASATRTVTIGLVSTPTVEGLIVRQVGDKTGASPVNAQVGTTYNGSDWTPLRPISSYDFYSGDGSGYGAGIKGRISLFAVQASASSYGMDFFVGDGTSLNHALRVGTDRKVGINLGQDSLPAEFLHISNDGALAARFDAYSNNATTSGGINFRKARGTQASSTQTAANDRLGYIAADGWTDSAAWSSSPGMVLLRAQDAFTASAQGTYLTVELTPTSSTTRSEVLRLLGSGFMLLGGGLFPTAKLHIAGTVSASYWGLNGIALRSQQTTYTDTSTTGSGTAGALHSFSASTVTASQATVGSPVTYPSLATVYISGAPTGGANTSITAPYAIQVASGESLFNGVLTNTSTNSNGSIFVTNTSNNSSAGRVVAVVKHTTTFSSTLSGNVPAQLDMAVQTTSSDQVVARFVAGINGNADRTSGYLAFSTASGGTLSEVARFTSANQLGIGITSNITSRLHVVETAGTVYAATISHVGGTVSRNGLLISTSGTSATSVALKVSTATSSDTFQVLADARVGIGITNPSSRLHVGVGAASIIGTVTEAISLTSTTDGAKVALHLGIPEGTNNRRVQLYLDDATGDYGFESTFSTGNPEFVINASTGERFRLSSSMNTFRNVVGNNADLTLRVQQLNTSANVWVAIDRADNVRRNAVQFTTGGVLNWGVGLFRNGGVTQNNFAIGQDDSNYSTAAFIINTSNQVGIGAAPAHLLDVVDVGTSGVASLRVRNTAAGGYASVQIDRVGTSRSSSIRLSTANTADWYIGTLYNSGAAQSALAFAPGTTDTFANSALTILTNKNIGMGINAPTAKVHIMGADATSGNTALLVEDSTGADLFAVRNDGAFAFKGGTIGLAQTGYNISNVVTDRIYDANATTLDEIADVLGTLINDLKTKAIIAA